jgi:hypothetical protein
VAEHLRHASSLDGDPGGRFLRRRHEEDLNGRHRLRHCGRHVTGPWRQIDENEVGASPQHLGQELLERIE